MRRWFCWDDSLMHLVPMFALFQCTAVHMRSWRHTSTIWAVGISRSGLKIRCLTCACSNFPSTDCVKRVWQSGPQLHDEVRRNLAQGGRDSRLEGLPTSTEEGHHRQRSWFSRTHGRCCHYCGSVTFDCFVPEGDRVKK